MVDQGFWSFQRAAGQVSYLLIVIYVALAILGQAAIGGAWHSFVVEDS
ncbi:MAG: hypothetical protein PVH03_00045 [Chloroflexota bacterium]|jgi:hypothetical protein